MCISINQKSKLRYYYPNSHFTLSIFPTATNLKNVRVTVIAENMLIKIPMSSVTANPFTTLVPNQIRIMDVIILETFESLIEVHALLNPSSIAPGRLLPTRSSSFILSKIKIFASTAIPTERINPAIPARVKVTGINLNTARIIAV